MVGLIPSKDVRDYCKTIGHEFSDFEKATIIYNSRMTEEEKSKALKELADVTNDEKTKTQIYERLEFDAKKLATFTYNCGDYIYAVVIEEDEAVNGYFSVFDLAVKFGRNQNNKFRISKYKIMGKELLISGNLIGEIDFNEKGKIISLWSNEIPEEEAKFGCENVQRFESRYIDIPNPFERGDIVQILTNGSVGIVETFRKDWEKNMEMITNGVFVDWTDVSITVTYLLDKGGICHSHINPIYLEKIDSWPNEKQWRFIQQASCLAKGEGSLDYFVSLYDELRER